MRIKKESNVQTGERIRLARERAKLTQEQFAERIDVSPQYVSDLERGVVGASVGTLKRICAALGVSSDQLLFGPETQSRAAAIAELCRPLSDRQFLLLTDMVRAFVEAATTAR